MVGRPIARWIRRLADWLHPPPAQSNIEFIAALKREFEDSQPKLTPDQRLQIRTTLLPNAVQREPSLMVREIERMRAEIDAEYNGLKRDTPYTRKLRMVKR